MKKPNSWQELGISLKSRFLDPGLRSEEALQATILVTILVVAWMVLIFWSTVYFIYGEVVAAVAEALFVPISLGLIIAYFRSDEKQRLLKILLLLGFVMVAVVDLSLGGTTLSGGTILWATLILAAFFAFLDIRSAFTMLLVYILLTIVSVNFPSYFINENNLPPSMVKISTICQLVAPSALVLSMLKFYLTQLKVARVELRAEKAKSETLLLNMLPEVIAARLHDGEEINVDAFDEVSVLFADIVGFTQLSASTSPQDLVVILNEIFSEFDRLAVKHGVEKIRTIGDGYMAVAGAPLPQADHAQRIVQMALDMQKYMRDRAVKKGDDALQMRIGINSGAAAAGIVGTTKFHYDLWGDAVNTASRMESLGKPDNIQIAEPTYSLVKDKFNCLSRGLIEIKGKGPMKTWFVVDAKV